MKNPAFTHTGSTAARPSAGQPVTHSDIVTRTTLLLFLVVASATATWLYAPGLWVAGMVVGFALALVNIFRERPSRVLISMYAIAEGVMLGGVSYSVQELTVTGQQVGTLVAQAVIATIVTTLISLWLFSSGRVRVTSGFRRFLSIALCGYLAFALVNLALSFFMPHGGWGPLRGGWVGVAVGVVAVILASMSLISDFAVAHRGVQERRPRDFAWTAAFGLVVTLVWLYLELLRLLELGSGLLSIFED